MAQRIYDLIEARLDIAELKEVIDLLLKRVEALEGNEAREAELRKELEDDYKPYYDYR